MSRYYENDYRNDYDHDGYDSDSGCGCGCSERREFPRCGLRVLVKPGCYKCKELKKYECRWTPPKYEYRYVRQPCRGTVAVSNVRKCCCN